MLKTRLVNAAFIVAIIAGLAVMFRVCPAAIVEVEARPRASAARR